MVKYDGYLIDLDGTMYLGSEPIPEAQGFIEKLDQAHIPYLYVTNNSSKTPEQVAATLRKFDIPATTNQVFTTSQATVQFMLEQADRKKTVYLIGEEGVRHEIEKAGFELTAENPDFVVMGIDRDINYEKLATATMAVRAGAMFISTNGDAAIPTERGLLPGNGSITSVVAIATGMKPIFIGKPEAIIMEQAIAKLGVKKERVIMVGDNYETDILAGIRYGIDTLIVHTGFTSPEQLATKEVQPIHRVMKLSEWEL
ncbi:HAD family hydrolase [Listeria newyorkensis]|uniref:HAD family hydrolase n=1 Tax=Listeria newyorkensis TaxID=1497681 RepID=A0ABX4XT17_9LIST|nr:MULTISPECIES: TIGR01457 family HAD-type hydrolase [Listeria]KGL46734.1 HAD family hydrolase [Listeriaceae bacterium FSL A5-0209]KGL37490.1 HAD family hydrolase [Listeria newyorkensis]PNP92147.1 HAD family hydrolase [Listeria newyorkensis]RQW65948.1 TIGR01457 family HAD-type hydrolase [Listeria sp. SHR_NRA_18]WAO23242.1 TIGR01457 family HAD-type hydrolase [Listeria newyorkensis]